VFYLLLNVFNICAECISGGSQQATEMLLSNLGAAERCRETAPEAASQYSHASASPVQQTQLYGDAKFHETIFEMFHEICFFIFTNFLSKLF